tara:strand:- start:66 stop:752 length:687 start_codon:yes stop_codon:yes gene_type:complete
MKLGLNIKNNVGGSWTPANISSLTHWYRYDTGITKDAEDDITAWNDQKGSNNLTADGSGSASPTYASGAVLFNAPGDLLTFGTYLDLGTFSIYIRMEASDFDGDFIFEETANEFMKIQSSTEVRLKIDGSGRHDAASGISLSADTKFNIGFERENTADTTDDQLFLFIDNASKSIGGSGGGTQVITELLEISTFGKPANNCKFYEIIICNNSLTTSDRSNLNAYLNNI